MAQVMMAQLENECISPSVLSMARDMIAQWENECISLCPLRGLGYDSFVGGWMCLTVCPLYGPVYDSSVGEWMNLTVSPLLGPGSNPGRGGVFQGLFRVDYALATRLDPGYNNIALSPITSTTHLRTSRREAKIQPWTSSDFNSLKIAHLVKSLDLQFMDCGSESCWRGCPFDMNLQIASMGFDHQWISAILQLSNIQPSHYPIAL